MGQVFTAIYGFFFKNSWVFFASLVILLGFMAFFGSRIQLEEDINKVIPASEKNDRLVTVLQHAGFADRMVFCVSLGEDEPARPDLLIKYSQALVDSLQSKNCEAYIGKIEYNFGREEMQDVYDLFYYYLPLFLDDQDYLEIDRKTGDTVIAESIRKDYEALVTAGGFAMRDFILKDPLSLTPLALKKLEDLQVSGNFELYGDHIMTKDRRNLFFFVIPANTATETAENTVFLGLIEKYREYLDEYFEGHITMQYFGSVAVSISNAGRIKQDIILTLGIAGILLLLFLGMYFRKTLSFLFLFIPALLGGGFAIAMLALVRSEVSAISLGLGSVMLGISIDYALHFLSHLKHTGNVKTVIKDIAGPVVTSSFTTATAFLCLLVLRSGAMHDLGLFAAFSILSSAVFTLVVLPQFFRKPSYDVQEIRVPGLAKVLYKVASYPYDRNKKLGWALFLLLIIFVFTMRRVSFEGNMDSMNYMPEELRQSENYLDSIADYKLRSVFVVSTAEKLEDALRLNESIMPAIDSLVAEGTVKDYSSLHDLYPSAIKQQEKIKRWRNYWSEGKIQQVKKDIDETSSAYRFKPGAFHEFYDLMAFDSTIAPDALEPLRKAFLSEYISGSDSLALVSSILKVDKNEKSSIYTAFEGMDDVIVFDRQSLTTAFMEGLRDDFNRLILLSMLVVFGILLISFGRLELAIITFIPLAISWVFTVGIMGLLGIRFNIFNIVISTFIFGLGIDYAIFTLRGLIQEYQYNRKKLDSYKTSILLSGITTIIGIGVLIFARHPALKSIAISAVIGITSVILITYTLLPRLFRFLVEHEGRSRKWPVTVKDFLFSINTLTIFLVGVIILDISHLIIRYLLPIPRKTKKLIFHRMLSAATWIIVYGSVNIRKKIWNRSGEDFKKPAIVVCNHQSHLDTVLTIMQNHRMVLLTNPWVQKSIFYRGFISYADFFSVEEGADTLKPHIEALVKAGYSILYFPEGTRSADLEIHRFHQGAFYMARELGLDILPIISYGSGNTMPKFEPFLKTTPSTITILPRIKPGDPLIKESDLATSKAIRHYMMDEYARIRRKIETPAFFRKMVIRNYLYRSPVLEWYMKVKIRAEDHYKLFDEYLPKEGKITDIGCGYGFMAYMLHLMASGRQITGYDHDPDKIDTANHCALKNDKLEFIKADIINLQPVKSDAFILADVLHYLPEHEQSALIGRCAESLAESGMIIIREADAAMRKKHLGTRLSEIFSTRSGFNMTWQGSKKLFFQPGKKYLETFSRYGLEATVIDETRVTSNLVYILRKKP